jgi:hypothetical protein
MDEMETNYEVHLTTNLIELKKGNSNFLSIPIAMDKGSYEAFIEKIKETDTEEQKIFKSILEELEVLCGTLKSPEEKLKFLTNIKTYLEESGIFLDNDNIYLKLTNLIETNEINRIKIEDRREYFQVSGLSGPLDVKFNSRNAIGAIKYNDRRQQIPEQEKVLKYAELIVSKIENYYSKLRFLKEVIFALTETGRRFIDKQEHLQNLTALYWEVYHQPSEKENKKNIDFSIALDVCERYLELCEDENNQEWFERRVLIPPQIFNEDASREGGMVSLRKELLTLKERLKTDPLLLKKSHQTLRRVKLWLLSRYNLNEARKIEFENPQMLFIASWLPEFSAFVVLNIVIWPYFCPWLMDKLNTPFFSSSPSQLFFILFYYISGLFIFGKVLSHIFNNQKISKFNSNTDLQIHLPRLASGIVVGYLILFNIDAWNGIFFLFSGWRIQWLDIPWSGVGKFLIPLMVVFVYILIEMNNVTGMSSKFPIWKKAGLLILRGYAYSILIGIVISDLFGRALLYSLISQYHESEAPENIFALNGWFGNIYPEVLILLAPLALFIGVFVQLLWEDKSLTEKI